MSNLYLFPAGNSSIGIRQRIAANQNFDGSRPSATGKTTDFGLNIFTEQNAGGMFDFENLEPIIVTQFRLSTTAALTTWDIYVIDLSAAGGAGTETGTPLKVASGAGVTYALQYPRILIGPKQALKLVTTGGTAKIIAEVWAALERGQQS